MTVAQIWDFEKGINSITYMRNNPGASWEDARRVYNRKIAEVCTPEEYTVSELAKCDVNVDMALIIYIVKAAFPAVSGRQIAAWILANAEKHHEIFAPSAWTKGGKLEIPD